MNLTSANKQMNTLPLFDRDPYGRSFDASVLRVEGDLVALDRTLFYPKGGGQPGDIGEIVTATGIVRVIDTFRDEAERSLIWHRTSAPLDAQDGMQAQGVIDWDARYSNMCMHSCLHLLCSLVDAPVTGCGMGSGKGRLDFDLPEMSLTKEQITHRLNEMIRDAVEITTSFFATAESDRLLALVRNKYALPPPSSGELKVIDIHGVDLQPCGGTHVRSTSEIPRVMCEKIEKKGRQNRRIGLRFMGLDEQ